MGDTQLGNTQGASSELYPQLELGPAWLDDKVIRCSVSAGGVSLTLRLRLECSIKTAESVSTVDDQEICPVTPVEKFFASKEKAPWMREETTIKHMLVMFLAYGTIIHRLSQNLTYPMVFNLFHCGTVFSCC